LSGAATAQRGPECLDGTACLQLLLRDTPVIQHRLERVRLATGPAAERGHNLLLLEAVAQSPILGAVVVLDHGAIAQTQDRRHAAFASVLAAMLGTLRACA
jgi:hypothetical protein